MERKREGNGTENRNKDGKIQGDEKGREGKHCEENTTVTQRKAFLV